MRKDSAENINPQIERYKKEGFPKGYGLLQSNILIRKHNNEDCIRLMEAWSNEVMNGSHRDQLSFNYCCWKNQDVKIKYLDKGICNSKWFKWYMNHKSNRSISRVISSNRTSAMKSTSASRERLASVREKVRNIINSRRIIHSYDVKIY
jgi:hypothetical protein